MNLVEENDPRKEREGMALSLKNREPEDFWLHVSQGNRILRLKPSTMANALGFQKDGD